MQNQKQFFAQFKGYPSIEPSTNTKFYKNITKSKANDPEVLWVATQKIHGSNFSIVYDFQANLVKYGRRTDFISNEIPVPVNDVTPFFKENFLDAPVLVNTFHNSLDKIKDNVQKKYPDIVGIQIYGEYFGGHWHDVKAECKKRVQLGVYYTPNHEFMAFDIRLYGDKFTTWVQVTQIPQIVENHLKHVPIYSKGSFEQIQEVAHEFDSTIPQLLGFQRVKDNICQGLILRPNKNTFQKCRIILKKKTQQFLQKAGFKKNNPGLNKPLHTQQKNEHVQYLRSFLNANRIESAISKYPDFEDQFHLKGHVIEDVFDDVRKEDEERAENLRKLKKVMKTFDRVVYTEVVGYLEEVRKEFVGRIKRVE